MTLLQRTTIRTFYIHSSARFRPITWRSLSWWLQADQRMLLPKCSLNLSAHISIFSLAVTLSQKTVLLMTSIHFSSHNLTPWEWNLDGLQRLLVIWFLMLLIFLSRQPLLLNFFRSTLKNDFSYFNQRAMERVWKACIPCILLLSKHHSDVISKRKKLRWSLLLWIQWFLLRSHLIMICL